MAREKTFNFVPLHQELPKDPTFKITVATKTGRVSFLKDKFFPERHLELAGQFVRFYIDKEKKTLAFRFFKEGELDELNHFKKVSKFLTGKTIVVCVGESDIKKLFPSGKTYSRLECQTYKDQSILQNNIYYYVTLD
jgi:hypothetical protein